MNEFFPFDHERVVEAVTGCAQCGVILKQVQGLVGRDTVGINRSGHLFRLGPASVAIAIEDLWEEDVL